MKVSRQGLVRLFPNGKAALIDAIVNGWDQADAAEINTTERISQFLANIGAETGGLKAVEENLNYSAARIPQVWPSRFRSVEAAKPYANNPEALANKVYARKDLGNTQEGDGWRYIGRGMMQTTGRANYRALGFEDNPQDLADPAIAFATAVREWKKRGCNALADQGDKGVSAVRRKINGGTNGLDHVKSYLTKARKIFAGITPAVGAAPTLKTPDMYQQAMDSKDHPISRGVQADLISMGFYEVGEVDGNYGGKTAAAITAFKLDRHIPGKGVIDKGLIDEIAKAKSEGWRRPISDARANATPTELAKKLPEVAASQQGEKVGFWAGVTTAVTTVTGGIVDFFGDATDKLSPLKEFLTDMPSYVWLGGALGLAGVLFYLSRSAGQAKTSATVAYQEGART